MVNVEEDNGRARLVDGNADPSGAWEYGLVEVLFTGVWSKLIERTSRDEALGRRGAQVACRSLGYATGAQLVIGDWLPFPATVGAPDFIRRITCDGFEEDLASCDIDVRDYAPYDYRQDLVLGAATLICTTLSGMWLSCSASLAHEHDTSRNHVEPILRTSAC